MQVSLNSVMAPDRDPFIIAYDEPPQRWQAIRECSKETMPMWIQQDLDLTSQFCDEFEVKVMPGRIFKAFSYFVSMKKGFQHFPEDMVNVSVCVLINSLLIMCKRISDDSGDGIPMYVMHGFVHMRHNAGFPRIQSSGSGLHAKITMELGMKSGCQQTLEMWPTGPDPESVCRTWKDQFDKLLRDSERHESAVSLFLVVPQVL